MTTLSELSSVGFSDSAETDPLRSRDGVWWVWGGRESWSVFRGVSWGLRGREGEKERGGCTGHCGVEGAGQGREVGGGNVGRRKESRGEKRESGEPTRPQKQNKNRTELALRKT